jgi:hypothetical protein
MDKAPVNAASVLLSADGGNERGIGFYRAIFGSQAFLDRMVQGTAAELAKAGVTTKQKDFIGANLHVDEGSVQVITLIDTDGSYCQKKGVEAFAALPASGKIYFCHSSLVLSSYTIHELDDITTHELGHVLANRGFHLGGEPDPGDCPSHAIMASNRTCRTSVEYTSEDRDYICNSHNVTGGICNPGRST